jgi:hypothetical protein
MFPLNEWLLHHSDIAPSGIFPQWVLSTFLLSTALEKDAQSDVS